MSTSNKNTSSKKTGDLGNGELFPDMDTSSKKEDEFDPSRDLFSEKSSQDEEDDVEEDPTPPSEKQEGDEGREVEIEAEGDVDDEGEAEADEVDERDERQIEIELDKGTDVDVDTEVEMDAEMDEGADVFVSDAKDRAASEEADATTSYPLEKEAVDEILEDIKQLESASSDESLKDFPAPILDGNAMTVLERRYLRKDDDRRPIEEPRDMFLRVAKNIAEVDLIYDKDADVDKLTRTFYNLMASLDFIPNSPTLMNAGRELQQLSACFVIPVEDSMQSIFEAVMHTALIHKSGGGTGFSFSRLRPQNDHVRSTKGVSSGPISFMTVFDAATETIKQGGTRRGANMGILRVDHPDILDFIHCKEDQKKLNNFNISVALTEEFMSALNDDDCYELKNPRTGEAVDVLKAGDVFDEIVEMAWKNGEPGIIFLDRLNKDNPTPNIGEIEATNPCGEQPLLPYESCNLGSINLSQIVTDDGEVDFDKLGRVTDEAVHFLDNVIDANNHPLPEIAEKTKANRKIGLGVMGFAEMLIKRDIPYNSDEALDAAEEVMGFIQKRSKEASVKLALDRGSFPNFYGSKWEGEEYPMMRNATTTTIAPTGTISIIANTSSGIEPLFALSFIRNVMDDDELIEVNRLFSERAKKEGFYSDELMREIAEKGSLADIDGIPEHIKKVFVTAHDISPEWHVWMQAAFQKFTDNAVSKTVNFPQDATTEDIRKVYELAYRLGCKGVTVYRDKSREAQVLNIGRVNREKVAVDIEEFEGIEEFEAIEKIEKEEHEVVSSHTLKSPRSRADVTWGTTRKMKTGCGALYVTINEDKYGIFEVFAQIGKAGGCSASQNETTGRLISLALRSGIEVKSIIKQLSGIRCPSPIWANGTQILSCSDAIAKALKLYIKDKDNPEFMSFEDDESLASILTCPDCGSTVVHESGCVTCTVCGFSKC